MPLIHRFRARGAKLLALAIPFLFGACQEPLYTDVEAPRITIIAAIDAVRGPEPTPAYVVWVSTYSGNVWYYIDGVSPGAAGWTDSTAGGELKITEIPVDRLTTSEVGQEFEIRLHPLSGGSEIRERTRIYLR